MKCAATQTILISHSGWSGRLGRWNSQPVYTHALNHWTSPREAGRKEGKAGGKFSQAFPERSVICPFPLLRFCTRGPGWTLTPGRQVCGVGCLKKPRATESIFGEIPIKKRLRGAQSFSGYRSKKRLGELASLCLSFFFFITLHVKDNRREREREKTDEWVRQTKQEDGVCARSSYEKKKKMHQKSWSTHTHLTPTSLRAVLRYITHVEITHRSPLHLLFLAPNILFHICISHIQQNSFFSILSFSAVLGRTTGLVYACTWCSVVLRGMPLASQRRCLSTAASSLLFSIQRDSRLISAPWTAANTLLLWQLEPADSCLEVRSVSSH